MDKARAIERFLRQVDQFDQIAFVTSEEVAILFGQEVTQALAKLEHFTAEKRTCTDCRGACCGDIGCELYAPQFGCCPIYEYRPIACRMHFCHRLDDPYRPLIIELRDIFVGCYGAADFSGSASLRSLDTPPFAPVSPLFVTSVGSCVADVREGRLPPSQATEMLHREVAGYRLHADARIRGAEKPGARTRQNGSDLNGETFSGI